MLPSHATQAAPDPLAVLSPLALAAPALAADTTVDVVDFAFAAKSVKVDRATRSPGISPSPGTRPRAIRTARILELRVRDNAVRHQLPAHLQQPRPLQLQLPAASELHEGRRRGRHDEYKKSIEVQEDPPRQKITFKFQARRGRQGEDQAAGRRNRSVTKKRVGRARLDPVQEHEVGQVHRRGDLHRRLGQEVGCEDLHHRPLTEPAGSAARS